MSSKVAFHTLGCKLNFTETSTIGSQFLERGFRIVDFKDQADIYVINTCTVTYNADKECRQVVRRALRQNPNAFVAVTGCYAQLKPDEISSIDGVDAVLGSNEKFKIFSLFSDFSKQQLACIHVTPTEDLDSFNSSFSSENSTRTRAFFKIQDGCDYTCTFCTIPLARGKSRSLSPDELHAQFLQMIDSGYKEIILTGVNVGDYGKRFQTDLHNVLTKIVSSDGDFRIRISSIEPNLLTDDILKLTRDSEKMCNHFHIPLQSGSGRILGMMQRRYSKDHFENLINKANEMIPDLGIGIDVIVGFPGESEEDFLETYNFLNSLQFSYLHVFTYSERSNTKAILMPDSVEIVERKRRNNMLRILSDKKKNYFCNQTLNKNERVLFEHENHDGFMYGWTSNYVRTKSIFDESRINQFSNIQLKAVDGNFCTIIEKQEQFNNVG